MQSPQEDAQGRLGQRKVWLTIRTKELMCRPREPVTKASSLVTHVGRDDPNAISWIETDAIDASN